VVLLGQNASSARVIAHFRFEAIGFGRGQRHLKRPNGQRPTAKAGWVRLALVQAPRGYWA